MKYTVKLPGSKTRPATPYEQAYIKKMMKLHVRYWKWQVIRAAAFITLIVLIVHK